MLAGPLPKSVRYSKLVSDTAILEGTIPLERFERLTEMLLSSEGDVQAKLEFRQGSRQRPLVVAKASTVVSLTCQVCLEPMEMPIEASTASLVVKTEEDLLQLEQHEDGIVVDGDDLVVVEVLQDAFILAVPMAPRHTVDDCIKGEAVDAIEEKLAEKALVETYRPFAGLKDLQNSKNRE